MPTLAKEGLPESEKKMEVKERSSIFVRKPSVLIEMGLKEPSAGDSQDDDTQVHCERFA